MLRIRDSPFTLNFCVQLTFLTPVAFVRVYQADVQSSATWNAIRRDIEVPLGANVSEFVVNITRAFDLKCHPTMVLLRRTSGPLDDDTADPLPHTVLNMTQFAEISVRAKLEAWSFVAACVPAGLRQSMCLGVHALMCVVQGTTTIHQ